jgi:GntR family transcriptional regulator, rspAB operon transcriptional repressor
MVLSYPVSTSEIEPIAYVDLSEAVYRLLRQKIFAREFPPRAKLDLDLLAKKLRVSRSPINKSIIRLAEEGLVRVEPRHGTFIVELTTREVAETWDLRLPLEVMAAEQGIPRVTAQAAAEARTVLDELSALSEDADENYLQHVRLDREFHLRLVAIADNRKLLQVYGGLHTDVINARLYYHGHPRGRGAVNTEHREILAAYEAGDLPAARAAINAWYESSKQELIRRIEELGGAV